MGGSRLDPPAIAERRDAFGPIVRLHSFKVPVRTQSEFLVEFDALLSAMRAARGFLGHQTFVGGRNPRHVMLLSAWSSKRGCESFFEAAEAPPQRKRRVFRYLEAAEFFREHEGARSFALAAGLGRRLDAP
jgi:heme-degrading monooxygenase HmoA